MAGQSCLGLNPFHPRQFPPFCQISYYSASSSSSWVTSYYLDPLLDHPSSSSSWEASCCPYHYHHPPSTSSWASSCLDHHLDPPSSSSSWASSCYLCHHL